MPATTSTTHDSRGFVDAAQVLQELAVHEQGSDPRRAAISASVAALVTACGHHVDQLPPEVTRAAVGLVGAVDRAAGLHR
ncbi:hypothetical protein Psed_6082 [Pseudonocardia dioxanivorans CB1190]|uniref:Uncharacterized protein n=1 Tax=Pseudonocardia dioxanivorans (strain ATCC 55486 / DSM 44775 / JCM 13855 / CB1190) TaxID=675635 RepID=F4CLQ5_PSEUX|nr:hypothetical protein [Pseudonocardia dioxanivorans]AEA28187.1 hypothetical protein Psed_6082 [Pseudonocardia dioxanivorans CB1190]